MTDQNELYSLLIPLRTERLLVPRMCVAEVITYADVVPIADGEMPDWLLGTIDWNGRLLPVVSLDGGEQTEMVPRKAARRRIVVFHALSGQLKSGYYGILSQGFPQLVRVNPDVITLDSEAEIAPDLPVLCRVRMIHEFPLIPDVERIESMVAELPRWH